MDGCIFCKIVAGEIPAQVVYENDQVLAFDDISPQAPVHVLIIPKEHSEHLSDPSLSTETAGALLAAVAEVARIKGVDESGYRLIANSGPDSRQEVAHLHLHVLGGRRLAAGMVSFDG